MKTYLYFNDTTPEETEMKVIEYINTEKGAEFKEKAQADDTSRYNVFNDYDSNKDLISGTWKRNDFYD